MNILIVDDNAALCRSLAKYLEHNGCTVDMAHDGKKGLRMALEKEYDIILLDIMMPQMNGYTVLKHLRNEGRKTPIIIISAKDEVSDGIEGLELGADDYIQKPFNLNMLLAKMKAVARRSCIPDFDSNILQYADVTLIISSRKLKKDELQITLSPLECSVMQYLIKNSSVVISEEKLMETNPLSNMEPEKISMTIESLVKMLRYICSKVEIVAIRGLGYKLCY